MKHSSVIRTIYLYLFAIIGLVLLVVSGVRFLDMGLKAFIFTKAEQELRVSYKEAVVPVQLERVKEYQKEEDLSEEEKEVIKQYLADWQETQELREQIDPVVARRHRDASINLAAILIGLPLYLYHWQIIKKETRRKKEDA